jgi:proton-translocating NADH-quinone oxidoreductase chain N
MIEILDTILPIISLVVFALLTVPVIRLINKSGHKTAFTLGWFATVFATVIAFTANLAIKYYALSPADGFVSLSFSDSPLTALSSAFMVDGISIYMALIFACVSAAVFLYAIFFINSTERPAARYYAIMLMLTAALIGSVFAGDLLTLFIFWEAATAGSCFLMLYKKNRDSINSTLKYIIMVVIASGLVVFGISLVYGITGTLNFWAVRDALMALQDKNLLILAFVFIVAGYAIEAAIVPFHFWLPSAYNAAPASTSAFLSALIDQGSYYVLIRVLIFILMPTAVLDWRLMIAIMAALAMVVGNLFALAQRNIKVLIGYICVADVGYNLVAMTSIIPGSSAGITLGLQGNLYFFLAGGITTALAFMAVGIINHYGLKTFDDFAGLGKKMPLVSLALVIAALSFAGVPPLAGFWGKYLVFTAAIQANYTWLAVLGVLMSVVQTAYLFRLINAMYAKKPLTEKIIKEPKRLLIPVFILVAAIIILGLFPSIILDPIGRVVQQFPFIP